MTAHLLPLDGLGLLILIGLAFTATIALCALILGGLSDERLEEWQAERERAGRDRDEQRRPVLLRSSPADPTTHDKGET